MNEPRNYDRFIAEAARLYPHLTGDEQIKMGIHNAETHPGFHDISVPLEAQRIKIVHEDPVGRKLLIAVIVLLAFIFLALVVTRAHAEPNTDELKRAVLASLRARPPQIVVNPSQFKFDVSGNLDVNCTSGCSGGGGGGGTSSNFGAAFPSAGTAAGASDGANMQPLLVDGSGYLKTILENSSVAVTGTFWQATQPVSGTFWQATQPVSGTFWQATQPVSVSDGGDVTQGAKADAKSTATDTTAVSVMQVEKEISYMEQNPASRAVTNIGTFATQSAITAASGAVADNGITTMGAKADAKNTATDTTAVSQISILKEISYMEQTPASRAVTNGGTFAVQSTLQAGSALAGEIVPVATATTTDTALRCTLVSAASTNATNCKAGSGNVYGYRFVNTTTTVYYLRMYNSSGTPTCSSATGFIETIPIPPAAAAGGAGGIVSVEPFGEGYSTGVAFCFTGGSSSTDTTNAATGVFGTILYK